MRAKWPAHQLLVEGNSGLKVQMVWCQRRRRLPEYRVIRPMAEMALMMTARLAALLNRMAVSVALMALTMRVGLVKKPSRHGGPASWTAFGAVGSGMLKRTTTAAGADHPVRHRAVGNSKCEGPGRLRHLSNTARKKLMVIAA